MQHIQLMQMQAEQTSAIINILTDLQKRPIERIPQTSIPQQQQHASNKDTKLEQRPVNTNGANHMATYNKLNEQQNTRSRTPCTYCNLLGHGIEVCQKKRKADGLGVDPNWKCKWCLEVGTHYVEDCPQRPQWTPMTRGQTGQTGNTGKTNNSKVTTTTNYKINPSQLAQITNNITSHSQPATISKRQREHHKHRMAIVKRTT